MREAALGADGDETPSIIDQYVTEDEDLVLDALFSKRPLGDFTTSKRLFVCKLVEGLTR